MFYPVTFLLSVPRHEILPVAQLLATKLVANEFVAYLDLQAIMASDSPLSERGYTIASYALCGFANLGSLGIQIGVLSALAPSRARVIAKLAASAMICGFISYVHPCYLDLKGSLIEICSIGRCKLQVSQVCLCSYYLACSLARILCYFIGALGWRQDAALCTNVCNTFVSFLVHHARDSETAVGVDLIQLVYIQTRV